MTKSKKEQLKLNFIKMFVIRAAMNIRMFNIISSIFYVSRGISYSELFLLAIIFAIGGLAFEVPSSYLADQWGRKKTILAGAIIMLGYWILILTGSSFIVFAFAALMYSATHSFFTGTDDALIYDTAKEIGEEKYSLRRLGKYQSARSVLKMFTVLIAAIIAKDLTGFQFIIIIMIDLLFNVVAIITAITIVEPNHHVDVEKKEAGILFDAWRMISRNRVIMMGMIGKSMIFVSGLILFQYHQDFLVSLGLGIVMLGVFSTIRFMVEFIFNRNAEHFLPNISILSRINIIQWGAFISNILFIIFYYSYPNPLFLVAFFSIILLMGSLQTVYYSEFFNKQSYSYNRATMLSLTNFLKSILEIPFLLFAAFLVSFSPVYPYFISLGMVAIVLLFIRLPKLIKT